MIEGQRSLVEVASHRYEVRGQRSGVGGRGSGVLGQRSWVRSLGSEVPDRSW